MKIDGACHCGYIRVRDAGKKPWHTPMVGGIPSEADYQRMLSAIDAAGPEYLAAFGITPESWKRWRQGAHNTTRVAEAPAAATLATMAPEGHANGGGRWKTAVR